ncbi:protein FAM161B [Thalassophryne amazonica]|uniref:protein FAM161B n=1 Tax=Thalassophryne amazonica TaxID=390379 RepID=UPI0014710C19|nr:protein FAM161B [Thalassophryne amazonica]
MPDGIESELKVKQQFQELCDAFRHQLMETQRRHRAELDRRMHQNSFISTNVDQKSSDVKELNHPTNHRRSVSASALTKESTHQGRQSERPSSVSPAWKSSSRTPERHQQALCTSQRHKEEEAEAECQKKFSALPVPSHVSLPLYQEMKERREEQRKQGLEQRKRFLLAMQKPFSFTEKEKEKREKLLAMLNQAKQDPKSKAAAARKPTKVVKESSDADLTARCRNPHTQSKTPHSPNLRAADRTKKEKLGFLDERPTFQPRIIPQVPDFVRLHKAFQIEVLQNTERKDVTKCQPFYLRTSALPTRQSKTSTKNSQEPHIHHVSRSRSLGALTSLSTDILPTYITDAARKRCMAIRKSMEMRDSKNQESAEWMKKYHMRSQTMKNTIVLHAKILDPHSSFKEVYDEKVQQHREADQQRMREYKRDLRDMKARVRERPFLFEQVKRRNAKVQAIRTFKNELKKVGLEERFVEEVGEAADETSASSTSECHRGVNHRSTENNNHSREENVDDGEKIEDVEEKSVKSSIEEMP